MTANEKRLIESLQLMMDWARELPDEFLDSDPDQRKYFCEDLAEAKAAIATVRGDQPC